MYYVLCCFSPPDQENANLNWIWDDPQRSWRWGERFTTDPNAPAYEQPPPEPVRVEVDPDMPGILLEFYDTPVPLMTKRLLDAFRAAGVANLDVYRAEIYNPLTEKTSDNYVAFNLIGTIAAADLKKSEHDPEQKEKLISKDFDSLAVNEQATRGALMFRLAESVNAILVHESVKQHLESNGIDMLTFIPPEQWAG